MKKLLLTFALLLTTSAFASNPTVFTGKYKFGANTNCALDGGTGRERVYISLTKRGSIQSIYITVYSDDSSGVEIPATSGVRQTPGTDPQYHGKVTDTITVKWPNPNTMISKKVTKSSSGTFSVVTTLSLSGRKLVVSEQNSSNESSTCELIRQ